MSIQTFCPGCDTEYQLPDCVEGKRLRCKRCDQAFVVEPPKKKSKKTMKEAPAPAPAEAVEEVEEAIEVEPAEEQLTTAKNGRPLVSQSSRSGAPRKAQKKKRGQEEDDEDEAEEPRNRRAKRVKAPKREDRGGVPIVPIVIGLGGVFFLLCLVVVGGLWWFLTPSWSKSRPVAANSATRPATTPAPVVQPPPVVNPPPVVVPPVNPPPNNPMSVTLSNPQVNRSPGLRMSFRVDYRFDQGRPQPGDRYFWIIKSNRGSYENQLIGILGTQGTLSGSTIARGGDAGPFEMYLEVERLGAFGRRERVSNSVTP